MKKGIEMSISMVIFAVLAIIVLVVIISIFTGKVGEVSSIFSEQTQETQKESSKISVFNGCCGGECLSDREPVGGTCGSSCEDSYTAPLNGWDDCKGSKPICCKT